MLPNSSIPTVTESFIDSATNVPDNTDWSLGENSNPDNNQNETVYELPFMGREDADFVPAPKEQGPVYDYFKLMLLNPDPVSPIELLSAHLNRGEYADLIFDYNEKSAKEKFMNSNIPDQMKTDEGFADFYKNSKAAYENFRSNELKLRQLSFKQPPQLPATSSWTQMSNLPQRESFRANEIMLPIPDPVNFSSPGEYNRIMQDNSAIAFQRGFYIDRTDGNKQKDLAEFNSNIDHLSWLETILELPNLAMSQPEGLIELTKDQRVLTLGQDESGNPVFYADDLYSKKKQGEIFKDFHDQFDFEKSGLNEFGGALKNSAWLSIPTMGATVTDIVQAMPNVLTGKVNEKDYSLFAEILKTQSTAEQYRRGLIDEEKGIVSWNGLPYLAGTVIGSFAQYGVATKSIALFSNMAKLGLSAKRTYQLASGIMSVQASDAVRQIAESKGIPREHWVPFALGAAAGNFIFEQGGRNLPFEQWLSGDITPTQFRRVAAEGIQDFYEGAGKKTLLDASADVQFMRGFQTIRNVLGKIYKGKPLATMDRLALMSSKMPNYIEPFIEEPLEEWAQNITQNASQILHDQIYKDDPKIYENDNTFLARVGNHLFEGSGENLAGGALGGFFGAAMSLNHKKQVHQHILERAVIAGQEDVARENIEAGRKMGSFASDPKVNNEMADALLAKLDYLSTAFKDSGLKSFYDKVVKDDNVLNKEAFDAKLAETIANSELEKEHWDPSKTPAYNSTKTSFMHAYFQVLNDIHALEEKGPESGKEQEYEEQLKGLQDELSNVISDKNKYLHYASLGFKYFTNDYIAAFGKEYQSYRSYTDSNLEFDNIAKWRETKAKLAEQHINEFAPKIGEALKFVPEADALTPKYIKETAKFLDQIKSGKIPFKELTEFTGVLNNKFDEYLANLRKKYGASDDIDLSDFANAESGNIKKLDESIDNISPDDIHVAKSVEDFRESFKDIEPEAVNTASDSDIFHHYYYNSRSEQSDASGKKIPFSGTYENIKDVIDGLEKAIRENNSEALKIDDISLALKAKQLRAFLNPKFKKHFTAEVAQSINVNDNTTMPEAEAAKYFMELSALQDKLNDIRNSSKDIYADFSTKYNIDFSINDVNLKYNLLNNLFVQIQGSHIDENLSKGHVFLTGLNNDIANLVNFWKTFPELTIQSYKEKIDEINKIRIRLNIAASYLFKFNNEKKLGDEKLREAIQAAVNATTKALKVDDSDPLRFDILFEAQNAISSITVSDEVGAKSIPSNTESNSGAFIASAVNYLVTALRIDLHEYYDLHKKVDDSYESNKIKNPDSNFFIDDIEQEELLQQAYGFYRDMNHPFKKEKGPEKADNLNYIRTRSGISYKNILSILGVGGSGKTFLVEMLSNLIFKNSIESKKPLKGRVLICAPEMEQINKLNTSVENAIRVSGIGQNITIEKKTISALETLLNSDISSEYDFVIIDEAIQITNSEFNYKVQEKLSGCPVFAIGDNLQYTKTKLGKIFNNWPVVQVGTEKTMPLMMSKRFTDPSLFNFNYAFARMVSLKQARDLSPTYYNEQRTSGVYAVDNNTTNVDIQNQNFIKDIAGIQDAGSGTINIDPASRIANTIFVTDTDQSREDIASELTNVVSSMNATLENKIKLTKDDILKKIFVVDGGKKVAGLERKNVYVRFSNSNNTIPDQFFSDNPIAQMWYTAISRGQNFVDVILPYNVNGENSVSTENILNDYEQKMQLKMDLNTELQLGWYTKMAELMNTTFGKYSYGEPVSNDSDNIQPTAATPVSTPIPTEYEETVKVWEDLINKTREEALKKVEGYNHEDSSISNDDEIREETDKSYSQYINGNFSNIGNYAAYDIVSVKFIDTNYYQKSEAKKELVTAFRRSFNTGLSNNPAFRKDGILIKATIDDKNEIEIGYYLNPNNAAVKHFLSTLSDSAKALANTKDGLLIGYHYKPDLFSIGKGPKIFASHDELMSAIKDPDIVDGNSFIDKYAPDYKNRLISAMKSPDDAEFSISYEVGKLNFWLKIVRGTLNDSNYKLAADFLEGTTKPNLVFSKDVQSLSDFYGESVPYSSDNMWLEHPNGFYVTRPIMLYESADASKYSSFYTIENNKVPGQDMLNFQPGLYIAITWSKPNKGVQARWVRINSKRFEKSDYTRLASHISEMAKALLESNSIPEDKRKAFWKQINDSFFSAFLTGTIHYWGTKHKDGTFTLNKKWEKFITVNTISNPNGRDKVYLNFKTEGLTSGNILEKIGIKQNTSKSYLKNSFLDTLLTEASDPTTKKNLYGFGEIMDMWERLNIDKTNLPLPFLNSLDNTKASLDDINTMINDMNSLAKELKVKTSLYYNMFSTNLVDVKTDAFYTIPENASDIDNNVAYNPVTPSAPKQPGPKQVRKFRDRVFIDEDPYNKPFEFEKISEWVQSLKPFIQVNRATTSDKELYGQFIYPLRSFLGAKFGSQNIELFQVNEDDPLIKGGWLTGAHEVVESALASVKVSTQKEIIDSARERMISKTGADVTVEEHKQSFTDRDVKEWLMDDIGRNLLMNKDGSVRVDKTWFDELVDILKSFVDQLLTFMNLARRYNDVDAFEADLISGRFKYDKVFYGDNDSEQRRFGEKQDEKDRTDLLNIFGTNSNAKFASEFLVNDCIVAQSRYSLNADNTSILTMQESVEDLYRSIGEWQESQAKMQKLGDFGDTKFPGRDPETGGLKIKHISAANALDFSWLLENHMKKGDFSVSIKNYIFFKLYHNPDLFKKLIRLTDKHTDLSFISVFNKVNDDDELENVSESQMIKDEIENNANSEIVEFEDDDTPSTKLTRLAENPYPSSSILKSIISTAPIYKFIDGLHVDTDESGRPIASPVVMYDVLMSYLSSAYFNNPDIESILLNGGSSNELLNNTLRSLYYRFYHIPEIDNTGMYKVDMYTNLFGISLKAATENRYAALKYYMQYGLLPDGIDPSDYYDFKIHSLLSVKNLFESEVRSRQTAQYSIIKSTKAGKVSNIKTDPTSMSFTTAIRNALFYFGNVGVNATGKTFFFSTKLMQKLEDGSTWEAVPSIHKYAKYEKSKENTYDLTTVENSTKGSLIASILENQHMLERLIKDGKIKRDESGGYNISEFIDQYYRKTENKTISDYKIKLDSETKGIWVNQQQKDHLIIKFDESTGKAKFTDEFGSEASIKRHVRRIFNIFGIGSNILTDSAITFIANNETYKPSFENKARLLTEENYRFGKDEMADLIYKMFRSIVAPEAEDFLSDEMKDVVKGQDRSNPNEIFIDNLKETRKYIYNVSNQEDFDTLLSGVQSVKEKIGHPLAHMEAFKALGRVVSIVSGERTQNKIITAKKTVKYLKRPAVLASELKNIISRLQAKLKNSSLRYNPLVNGQYSLDSNTEVSKLNYDNKKEKSAESMNKYDFITKEIGLFIDGALSSKKLLQLFSNIPGKSGSLFVLSWKPTGMGESRNFLTRKKVKVTGRNKKVRMMDHLSTDSAGIVNDFKSNCFQNEARRFDATIAFTNAVTNAYAEVFKSEFPKVAWNDALTVMEQTGNYSAMDNVMKSIYDGVGTVEEKNAFTRAIKAYGGTTNSEEIGNGVFVAHSTFNNYGHYHEVPTQFGYSMILPGNMITTENRIQNGNPETIFDYGDRAYSRKNLLKLLEFEKSLSANDRLNGEKSFQYLRRFILNAKLIQFVNELEHYNISISYNLKGKYSFGKEDERNDRAWFTKSESASVIQFDEGATENEGYSKEIYDIGNQKVRIKLKDLKADAIPYGYVEFAPDKRSNDKVKLMRIHPAYEAYFWAKMSHSFNVAHAFGATSENSKNSFFAAARNKMTNNIGIVGSTSNSGAFGTMLSVTLDNMPYFFNGERIIAMPNDGESLLMPVAAAMLHIANGGELANMMPKVKGSMKNQYGHKNPDGTFVTRKGKELILSELHFNNNTDLRKMERRFYSVAPVIDIDGVQKYVWDIYKSFGYNAEQTASRLIEIRNIPGNENIANSFISFASFDHVNKTTTEPTYSLQHIIDGNPIYATQIFTDDYRNVAKMHNDLVKSTTSGSQLQDTFVFGQQNDALSKQLSNIRIDAAHELITKELAHFTNNGKPDVKMANEYVKQILLTGLRGMDGIGNAESLLSGEGSPAMYNLEKSLISVLSSKFKNLTYIPVTGSQFAQTSSIYIRTFFNPETRMMHTYDQMDYLVSKGYYVKIDENIYTTRNGVPLIFNYGFRDMSWYDKSTNSPIIHDGNILSLSPMEIKSIMDSYKDKSQLQFEPAGIAHAFRNYKKFGYSDDPKSPNFYKNFDIPQILAIPMGSSIVLFSDLGRTAEDRKDKLMELINTGVVDFKDTHAWVMTEGKFMYSEDDYESIIEDDMDYISKYASDNNGVFVSNDGTNYTIPKGSIARLRDVAVKYRENEDLKNHLEEAIQWFEDFWENLHGIVQRTPATTPAFGTPTRQYKFDHYSENDAAVSHVMMARQNSDNDGDGLKGTFKITKPKKSIAHTYNNKLVDAEISYYENPDNAYIYMSKVDTSYTQNALNESLKALEEFNKIFEDTHYVPETDLKSVYGAIEQASLMENSHYAENGLTGMAANILKAFLILYQVNPGTKQSLSELDMRLFVIADMIQAILDHEKTPLVDKININPLTINAVGAMIIDKVPYNDVISFISHPFTQEHIKPILDTHNIDEFTPNVSVHESLRNQLKYFNALKEYMNSISDMFANATATNDIHAEEYGLEMIKSLNSDIAALNYHTGFELPFISYNKKGNENKDYDDLKKNKGIASEKFGHKSFVNLKNNIDLRISHIEKQMLPAFEKGNKLSILCNILRLTTKSVPGKDYEQRVFERIKLAQILDSDFSRNINDNDKNILKIGNYIPKMKNGELDVLYAEPSRKVYQDMINNTSKFINFQNIINSDHYLFSTIIPEYKNYLEVILKLVVPSKTKLYNDVYERVIKNLGFGINAGYDAWNESRKEFEKMMIWQWLHTVKSIKGLSNYYPGLSVKADLDFTNIKGVLSFLDNTVKFIRTLKTSPESFGLSREDIMRLEDNEALKMFEISNYANSDRLGMMENVNTEDPMITASIRNGLSDIENIFGMAKNDLVNKLWLYQMMTNGFDITKYDLTRALPGENSVVLEGIGKFLLDVMYTLNSDVAEVRNEMVPFIEAAIMNAFIQASPGKDSLLKTLINTSIEDARDTKNAINSSVNDYAEWEKHGKWVYGASLIRLYDKAAYEASTNSSKKTSDFYGNTVEYIPMNREAIEHHFPGEADQILQYRNEIKNIPVIVLTNHYIPAGNFSKPITLRYDAESKVYRQAWAAQSKAIPSVNDPLKVISDIPTVKPGIQDTLAILNGTKNTVTFESRVYYKYNQEILLPDNLRYVIKSVSVNQISIAPANEEEKQPVIMSMINRVNTKSAIVKEVFDAVRNAIIENALKDVPKKQRKKIRTADIINHKTEEWIYREIINMHMNGISPETMTAKLIDDLIC